METTMNIEDITKEVLALAWASFNIPLWEARDKMQLFLEQHFALLDGCEICHGAKGGVPGNENIVDGKVMCDYCHADTLRSMRSTFSTGYLTTGEEAPQDTTLIQRISSKPPVFAPPESEDQSDGAGAHWR
jgi:hypothetical protein